MEKRQKKKAGLFRPGLPPFKTPVSALILPSAASKKQQKKIHRVVQVRRLTALRNAEPI
jgi:hypothetical protein